MMNVDLEEFDAEAAVDDGASVTVNLTLKKSMLYQRDVFW